MIKYLQYLVKPIKGDYMEKQKMLDVQVGTTVRSAARAPIDGTYEFVEHVESTDCTPPEGQRTVYLLRGEIMPRSPACNKRCLWNLVDISYEIRPDKDSTEYAIKVVRGDNPDIPYPAGEKK
jgi:hypothetical protein